MSKPVWQEPGPDLRDGLSELLLPGVERVRRMAAESTLPLQRLVGLRITDVEVGRVVCRLPTTRWLGWLPSGQAPTAVVGLAMDAATGLAAVSILPAGDVSSTAQLTVACARTLASPPSPTASIELVASVVDGPGGWVMVDAHADDDDGRFVRATSHCLRTFRLRTEPSASAARPRPARRLAATSSVTDPYQRTLPPRLAAWPEDAAGPGRSSPAERYREALAAAPLADLFGITVSGLDDRSAVLSMPATRWIARDGWTVFGGALALLGELAMTAAVEPAPFAAPPLVLECRTNFVRRARPDGRHLSAAASVTRRGGQSAIAGVEIRDASGELVALGSATLALRQGS